MTTTTETKTDNKTENKEITKLVPVFRIKPSYDSNYAKIKFVGNINENDKLGDEQVELDEPIHPDYKDVGRNAIPLSPYGKFEILGRIYHCNIVGSHIVASTRYPVLYLSVEYQSPIASGSLFQMFYSIDMPKETKKSIKDKKKYVNFEFKGNWVRHIDCDDELVQNYERFIKTMLNEEAKEYVNKLVDLTDDEKDEARTKYIEKEREYYDELMKDKDLTYKSIKIMRNEIVKLCKDNRFNKFIEIAMRCRELHRRKQHGINENDNCFVVSNKTVNMKDIENEILSADELVRD